MEIKPTGLGLPLILRILPGPAVPVRLWVAPAGELLVRIHIYKALSSEIQHISLKVFTLAQEFVSRNVSSWSRCLAVWWHSHKGDGGCICSNRG